MNHQNQGRNSRGFTLMELMVVISIIAILAGIVLFALPGIVKKIKRSQTELFLQQVEAGLSAYKQDNGMYPLNPVNENDGGAVLYKYLSGDFDGDGMLDPVSAGTKIYIEGIDRNTAKNQAVQKVGKMGNQYVLVDPFGSPLRYLAEPPGKKNKKTDNPGYDLWSLGGADPTSTSTKSRAKWMRP